MSAEINFNMRLLALERKVDRLEYRLEICQQMIESMLKKVPELQLKKPVKTGLIKRILNHF